MAQVGQMQVINLIVLAVVDHDEATVSTITKRLRKHFANEPDEWVRNQLCDETKVGHKLARFATHGFVKQSYRNALDGSGAVRTLHHYTITDVGRNALAVARRFLALVEHDMVKERYGHGAPLIRQRFVVACLAGQPGHEGTRKEIQASLTGQADPHVKKLASNDQANKTLQACIELGWLELVGKRGRLKVFRVTSRGREQLAKGQG